MNYFMDFDPHLIRQRNEEVLEEVRTVQLEEVLRENKGNQERKEKRTMMRNAASKVMRVGRATVFMVGLAVTLALVFGVATTALGATGASFILGKPNSAETPTSLVSTLSKATQSALSITNKSGGPALSLGVLSGKAPLKVSATAGTATNLSADKLDGKDSSEFLGKTEKATEAVHADSADHATSADSANSAGDANTLDGLDSIALQRRVSTECDPGSSIRAISEDGTPTCEPDDDTSATQVNALKTELGTNDNAPNEPSDPVSYTKLKDVPSNIASRDADTLDGKDSAAFLGASQKAADSDKLDGKDSTDFQGSYKRTVVVSPPPVGQAGDALQKALNGITNASANSPYLIYIEPGTYFLNTPLQMKPYVDIQGAGEGSTLLISDVSTSSCSLGTVMGANNAELRFLTVQNNATIGCSVAINNNFASPRLTHVTAVGAGGGCTGSKYGVRNSFSNPIMTNVTAKGAPVNLSDRTCSPGSYGVYDDSSSPTIIESKLSGSSWALVQSSGNGGAPAMIAFTQFVVGNITDPPPSDPNAPRPSPISGVGLWCFNNYDKYMTEVTC